MNNDNLEKSGIVFDIQRFSLHDGPGIRTLVFLKGCALRCRWCSNPESHLGVPQTIITDGKYSIVGERKTVREVMEIVVKDEIYYRRSGGGVTLSGGEALLQPSFSAAILEACKRRGYTTAIETAGLVKWNAFEEILPYIDLIMMDIKHTSSAKHKEFTGQPNEQIIANAQKLAKRPVNLIIRCPVIPGFNDTAEEIRDISRFAASLASVKEMHLLPYHRMGEKKYATLDREYTYAGIEPMSKERMLPLLAEAEKSGLKCQIGG